MSTIQRLSLSTDVPTNIEVWQLTLNLQMPVSHLDFCLLNESERNRALRFRAHEDQVRSIVTRAALRRLLAQKIMRQPEKLNFVTNEYGKPSLQSDTDIQFNVSHAGCFALLAFSTGGSIGVDIESCNRQININGLGKYVFTAVERTTKIKTTTDFIRHWVAKEAILKAWGVGISEHLQSISVLHDSERYRVVCDRMDCPTINGWAIEAPDDYAAALAVVNRD